LLELVKAAGKLLIMKQGLLEAAGQRLRGRRTGMGQPGVGQLLMVKQGQLEAVWQ